MDANIRRLKDLPPQWLKALLDFFVNDHNLEGKKFRLPGSRLLGARQLWASRISRTQKKLPEAAVLALSIGSKPLIGDLPSRAQHTQLLQRSDRVRPKRV
jgi:hypothetical protein